MSSSKTAKAGVDATVRAQTTLGVVGVPTTLLIDREGREVARYTGAEE